MKNKISKEVECPYYHSEQTQKILCEGVNGYTSLHLAFAGRAKMAAYKKEVCCKNWESCLIAQMHNRKWGVE